ncbi:MAG: hypothetical protein RL138_1715 [Bacteroidota bacterium]
MWCGIIIVILVLIIQHMKKYFLLSAVIASLVAVGCLKDQAAQVKTVVAQPGACDTITYAKHIQPLMDMYCAYSGCHSTNNSPRVPLTTYAEVSLQAASIDNHVFTLQDMPLGGTMSAAELQQLRCWLDNGKKQ